VRLPPEGLFENRRVGDDNETPGIGERQRLTCGPEC